MKSQRILTHLLGMAGLQFDWLEFSSKTTYKYQHIFLSEKVKTSQTGDLRNLYELSELTSLELATCPCLI